MVEVELREAYMNADQVFVITKFITMPEAPVKGMGIIDREWSNYDEYDYITDVFMVERVVFDSGLGMYVACAKVELDALEDCQLQQYVVRMLAEMRIGWSLYKIIHD